jgi:serine/threonine-protein kinase
LWCQEKYCPAEESPEILDHGDWIGDMEVVNMLTVTRTFALYEARRGEYRILLKIAHPGMQENLKREARLLVELSKKRQHPALPKLLPAYSGAKLQDLPYGKTVFSGKTRYYEVFDYQNGETLRAMLLKNPTPFFQVVGWILLGLCDVVAYIHQSGRLHFCLSPEVVFVRFDKQGVPRPLLIDLGIADTAQNLSQIWDKHNVTAAYTAPEIVEMKGKVGPATDVYGLGMILYEMLAGHPAYEYQLARDEDVYIDILRKNPPPTGRVDLKNIPEIAERAITKDYAARYKDVFSFAKDIQANLPRVPIEKKPLQVNWRVMAVITGTALAVSLLLALAVLIQG